MVVTLYVFFESYLAGFETSSTPYTEVWLLSTIIMASYSNAPSVYMVFIKYRLDYIPEFIKKSTAVVFYMYAAVCIIFL